MASLDRLIRLAGVLYLVDIVAGTFCLMYVPAKLTVSGDIHATIGNILASQGLFRAGIAVFALEQAIFLVRTLVFYRILEATGRQLAVAMVAFVMVGVSIALVGLGHRMDLLSLLAASGAGQARIGEQAEPMVRFALRAYDNDLLLSSLFWGLWLLPFGCLVFRSGFLPRVLGALLVAGGLSYVLDVAFTLLWPGYVDTALSEHMVSIAGVAEIGICLWMLLVGAGRRTGDVVQGSRSSCAMNGRGER